MSSAHYPIRRSPRAPAYDYAAAGWYFVTIVTHRRAMLFGDIADADMRLNEAGELVAERWRALSERFPELRLGACVVMPNHLHGLIRLDPDVDGGTSVSAVIGAFKSVTTNDYIEGVKTLRWPPFDRHVWQRSFHDRIVRDEDELRRISEYIEANPRLWAEDKENPDKQT